MALLTGRGNCATSGVFSFFVCTYEYVDTFKHVPIHHTTSIATHDPTATRVHQFQMTLAIRRNTFTSQFQMTLAIRRNTHTSPTLRELKLSHYFAGIHASPIRYHVEKLHFCGDPKLSRLDVAIALRLVRSIHIL